jgi:molecular chaperone GrpE
MKTVEESTQNMSNTQSMPAADEGAGVAPAEPTPEASPAGEPDLAGRLAELEARHAEVSDAYLRAKAEAENIRRRSEDEIAKARKYAIEGFAESLLPVKDSLEAALALQNSGTPATAEQMLEGVHATLRQLVSALERNKVAEVNPAVATKFDPHQHQAISVVPAEQEANTVVTVLQKGYLIADRVLRPALVIVAAAK